MGRLLTREDRVYIRNRIAKGAGITVMATKFGISTDEVRKITGVPAVECVCKKCGGTFTAQNKLCRTCPTCQAARTVQYRKEDPRRRYTPSERKGPIEARRVRVHDAKRDKAIEKELLAAFINQISRYLSDIGPSGPVRCVRPGDPEFAGLAALYR